MKTLHERKLPRLLLLLALLTLGICLLVACGGGGGNETDPATDAPTDPVTDVPTDPVDTVGGETDPVETVGETEASTEEVTEAPVLWAPDMGTFNEGKVTYVKEVETTVLDAYPDDKLGGIMLSGDKGINTLFSADFADGDPTAGDAAIARDNNATVVVDGKFYMPYDASSDDLIVKDGWTTWSIATPASVKTNKQVQLALDWEIVSRGGGAWMTAIWGCYVSNYAGKIPDGPGDGLWISFNPTSNKLAIYHPDQGSWPAGFVDVPLEEGLLSGQIKTHIVCTSDYTTYVYITPTGGTDARLVCTIVFTDGKMKVYNEANEMVTETDCTTSSLQGDNFVLFTHAGGGVKIEEASILAASKGEVIENVTITATPTEGNTLGLDITDKTDLVSICYSVWFDAILGKSGGTVDNWHNITEILAGKQDWGPAPSFHYWAKPALGYYSSSNKEVIRTHMSQLYEAGVDFIVIDLTNAGDGYMSNSGAWMSYIQIPMDAICDTIMEMRAEGKGTPYVVFWAGDSEGPLYQALYDRYHANEAWKDCFVYWDGKPFLLTTHKTEEDFPLKDLYTTRSMWGLGVKYDEGQWSFLSVNNYGRVTNDKHGKPEQISVAVATQETYMSEPTAHGRNGGIFWYCQWHYAFEVHPKVVGLTWWNEWTAQRYEISPGKFIFTDNYNQEFSRDIEPMEGGHGDQYYQWLKQYIAHYKAGLDCPVLVEEAYIDDVDRYLEQAQRDRP